MIDTVIGCWEEAFILLKHQMTEAAYAKVKQAQEHLRQVEVTASRMKIDELNKSILSLNLLILKAERQMKEVQSICPDVMMSSIKKFLIELKQRKGELEVQKRVIARAL